MLGGGFFGHGESRVLPVAPVPCRCVHDGRQRRHKTTQALVEQLRQQQLELAQAPLPQPRLVEEQVAPKPVPETTDAVPATAEGEQILPAVAPESGEDPGDGSGGAKVEVPETETEEAATGEKKAAAAEDLEESRKRRESMKNNAEQVTRQPNHSDFQYAALVTTVTLK